MEQWLMEHWLVRFAAWSHPLRGCTTVPHDPTMRARLQRELARQLALGVTR